MDPKDFTRLVNNFYLSKGLESKLENISLNAELFNYVEANKKSLEKKYKVGFLCICLNEPYWPFVQEMMNGAREFFLPGHDVDFLFWTDMPNPVNTTGLEKAIKEVNNLKTTDKNAYADGLNDAIEKASKSLEKVAEDEKKLFGARTFKIEPMPWPYPTLFRYRYFLQQEEVLKEYDYIFYCDVDMKFVDIVGDEILGSGLTAAVHPMYHLDKKYWPPYEPNQFSTAFIKRPGKIINDNGQPRFMPLYYAGGFQGGKTQYFIDAMKYMDENIKNDLNNGYIAIWNDESHWNKYLSENEPEIVLSPSYIYPDSLINEYYSKIWGKYYQPKLITLTKKFTTSTEGGKAVQEMLQKM